MGNSSNFTRINRREVIILCALLLLFLIVFNFLNFSQSRWTLHPDDHDIFVFSKVLLQKGHLWYSSPLNEKFKTRAFQPSLDDYESKPSNRYAISSLYSPGMYFLVAPGHLLGLRGPFVIVGIIGVFGILFLYLLSRDLYGKLAAITSSLFLGFSAPYLYWSNMLFCNIGALSFFIAGTYFLNRAIKGKGKKNKFVPVVVFFAISIWVRYDFLLLVMIVVIVSLIAYRKTINKQELLRGFIVLVALTIILATINHLSTGTISGYRGAIGAGKQTSKEIAHHFVNIPDMGALLANTKMYLFGMAPVLVLAAMPGIALLLRKERNYVSISLLAAGIFALYSYGKTSGFYAYQKNWLASSYTRYFLPVFFVLSICASISTTEVFKRIRKKWLSSAIVCLILITHICLSFFVLYRNQYGLDFAKKYSRDRKNVNAFVSTLPASSVIIDGSNDDYFRFDITSRVVLNPSYFPEKEAYERLAGTVRELSRMNIPLFLINNPERSMIDVEEFQRKYPYIELIQIPHPAQFSYGSRTPDFYRIQLKEDVI
ncbi:MAG: glycosyltransferase family 39 protein [Actinomycetota bacterium]|nr:glycosyltransferase family 39 protein [Actinomycetota bacterium]